MPCVGFRADIQPGGNMSSWQPIRLLVRPLALPALVLLASGPLLSGERFQAAPLPSPQWTSGAEADTRPAVVGDTERPPSTGSEPEPVTLEFLEHLALRHNPTVALAARRVEALRGKYQQVGLYPNPVVGYVGEEMGNEGHAGQQGIAVGQPIVTAGKLGWNQSVVGSEIAAAEQEWAMQRLRVTNDVRVAAYGVMAAQQTVELSEELLHLAEEGLRIAEQLFAAQEVSRVDVLQARLEVNSARLAVQKARHAVTQQWRRLALLAGVPDLTPAPLADDQTVEDPSPLSWDEALVRMLRDSPERMRAVAKIEQARAAVGRECAGRVPDVELEAGVRYNFGSDDTLATLGMAMPLQLFDRNQGNIYRAQAELAAAHQELRRVELSLRERLADEFRRYLDADQTVTQYQDEILPDARDALKLAGDGYRQGEFDYLELLTVQQTYFRTHVAYVDAIRDARVSRVRIEGLLLRGGLESPGTPD